MVSDRFSKVQKQIAKKKGKNPNLHEGSRDTKRMQRASARDDKLNRLTKLRENENRHFCVYKKILNLSVADTICSEQSEGFPVLHSRTYFAPWHQGIAGHD